jgi:hypothetical protein
LTRPRPVYPVYILFALLIPLLAACGQRSADTPSAPTATPTLTPTIDRRPTLPPSWTPGPPPTRDPNAGEPTLPPPPQPVEGRATLPPSWTPRPFITVTPIPFVGSPGPSRVPPTSTPAGGQESTATPRADIPPTLAGEAQYPTACATFGKTEPTDIVIVKGSPAQVSWTKVEGAAGYRVWLLNPSRRYSFDQVVDKETITIPEDAFIGPGPYAWEVMPLLDGDRMCVSLTGVITVRAG